MFSEETNVGTVTAREKGKLMAAERVVVAADFEGSPSVVRRKVLAFADELSDTGVYLKCESAIRICGYGLIGEIQNRLNCFADLKFSGIPEILSLDGNSLAAYQPAIVTVMCNVGVRSLMALKAALPKSEVVGVTVLTNLNELDAKHIYDCTVNEASRRLAFVALKRAGLPGIVGAAMEVEMLRKKYGHEFTFNAANIRPRWAKVKNDDQNPQRTMTPFDAVKAGATRIIVGRPITQSTHRHDAVMWTIEEVDKAIR